MLALYSRAEDDLDLCDLLLLRFIFPGTVALKAQSFDSMCCLISSYICSVYSM